MVFRGTFVDNKIIIPDKFPSAPTHTDTSHCYCDKKENKSTCNWHDPFPDVTDF